MSVDDSLLASFEAMRRRRLLAADEPQLPLHGGDEGGTSGGMEARIARLEASMDYVKAELGKLSGLPAESARIAERLNHMPTKIEMKEEIEKAVDRSAARMQRTVTVVGGLLAILIAVTNYLPKLLGHG